jgi:glutaredoxin 3
MQQKAIIRIYTWDHCPHCQKALALLNKKNLEYEQIKLDGKEDERQQLSLITKGNRKSVPQIFVDNVSIGGCDDLHALEAEDKLDTLIYG